MKTDISRFPMPRRRFLQVGLAGLAYTRLGRAEGRVRAYVGTYSSPEGPEGSKGNGKGIVVFDVDPATGALQQTGECADPYNPSCLAFHPSQRFLYAANEVSTFEGRASGAVSAYAVGADGQLKLLNRARSEGTGPAHLSVHPSGRFVLVANYFGGSFAVLPIAPDGTVGVATDVKRDGGPMGALHATSAPKGSFAISGHDRPHAHMIEADATGEFVIGTDLGTDRIHVWRFDLKAGQLNPLQEVRIPSGDGPRHFAFHPNKQWMYSLQEEGSTIIRFDWNVKTGMLEAQEQISSLPPGFAGTNYTSEIAISSDGRFLYAANRLHDSIAVFSIAKSGHLTFASECWTRGDYPRYFGFDPSGLFLYSCNQRSDAVACFRVNRQDGSLTFTGNYTAVGTPSIIVFSGA